jgi:UDP-N-acetylmuramoyl-L-alanyl-D-glutamate--2,6-diaminopimelate ligase
VSAPRPTGLPAQSLRALAALVGLPAPQRDAQVTGATLDSRAVRPGDLFAALPGEHAHGARFAAAAARAGAAAILTDEQGAAVIGSQLPVLVAASPRAVVGRLAAQIYGQPSTHLSLIGVTGTNGKTTTAYLIEAGLAAGGYTTALLGTVESRLAGERLPQARTTPEAPDLQAMLAVARQRGVQAGVMEVSSHALALGRVAGTRFAAGVFTNLSQDHLDFHGDLESYFAAKASLFRAESVATAVLCVDDAYGERLMEQVRVPHVTVSAGGLPWADWRAEDLRPDARGTGLRALGPAGEDVALRVPLPGAFNVANALTALASLVAVGVDPLVAARGIAGLAGVPGRLERIDRGQAFTALVDYAHTPAAVATLLDTLRPLTAGRLVVVLGCGGDRDRAKRPLMARAALAGSDLAVFTSDNPRSEDPAAVLADMTRDLAGSFVVQPDRAAAIALAAAELGTGDTLVVAGKGHETGQDVRGVVTPFDDRLVLGEVASARRVNA